MPKVTIDGRTVEVDSGTNLIEAAQRVGVQIPHYCYHPRLRVVGQCRMCLVKIEGMGKLQTACTTDVTRDGMVVKVDDPEVKAAQEGIMEFLLINHPLDCPICDQAGECGLQDYSFKHGQAFSRFRYEEKRTYPSRQRIPLGPTVVLNMNRCIHCTRCIRFTEEISQTSELGFLKRGWRTEIGTFPGKELDNPLSTCVVDLCPVGALTSSKFRFAERVWYLDKKPSICTGCDAGCNISLEHRKGQIKRYKPRLNPEVNDYWMCDFGRASFERYNHEERLAAPRSRSLQEPEASVSSWNEALDAVHRHLTGHHEAGAIAFLGSGFLTTEESFLLARLADAVGSPHRSVAVDDGPERFVPNPGGGVKGTETAPNRRGAELAGLAASEGSLGHKDLLEGDGAEGCAVLFVADSSFGSGAYDSDTIARLRKARFLVVLGWADSPLARVADVALPVTTHAEKSGTFVNSQNRLQRFDKAFPSRGEGLPTSEVLLRLLTKFDESWSEISETGQVFDRMAAEIPELADLSYETIPATGIVLEKPVAAVAADE